MRYDQIGNWSEIKLEIIRKYAQAYSAILSAQLDPSFTHIYIDAFAGAGKHISRATGKFVLGSPLNALAVEPPFREYHLIDINKKKVEELRKIVADRPDVYLYNGDCNNVLLSSVLPRVNYDKYRRGLCILDPYGLHLDWEVIDTAGKMRSVEILLNFPVMDMNMNVLWRPGAKQADPEQEQRMTAFWGNESWKDVRYRTEPGLFGDIQTKADNETIAGAFQKRLKEAAGFAYVPKPIPMRNTKGATVYYLFFACQKPVASKIIKEIFEKYRKAP